MPHGVFFLTGFRYRKIPRDGIKVSIAIPKTYEMIAKNMVETVTVC